MVHRYSRFSQTPIVIMPSNHYRRRFEEHRRELLSHNRLRGERWNCACSPVDEMKHYFQTKVTTPLRTAADASVPHIEALDAIHSSGQPSLMPQCLSQCRKSRSNRRKSRPCLGEHFPTETGTNSPNSPTSSVTQIGGPAPAVGVHCAVYH